MTHVCSWTSLRSCASQRSTLCCQPLTSGHRNPSPVVPRELLIWKLLCHCWVLPYSHQFLWAHAGGETWSLESLCPQQQSWAESWKHPCMGRLIPGSPWCEEEGKLHVSQPAWKSHRQSTGFPWEFSRVVQACQSVGPWELSWFMVSHLPLLLDMGPQHCSQRDRWLQDGARWGGLVHQGWAVP